ncbi:MAG TPA: heparan-alpha-glucosaminide N-acetyltransferase domain-containing protein, partial [Chitinophagaceae bacterium]|nr:heparan-alpha-glucosaminide N-acetyltransferase domain-containing protein [Chitinophagaceae bacterium]
MELKGNYRIASIDILRGIVMIIMALDHTRDFFHSTAMTADPLDPATTHPALYFTRWITHFCAPVFVFLSGLSAWLSSQKKSKTEASLFLVKRGLWLVIVEITLVTFGITFNPNFNFLILQVIWVIGWSMVLLGILVRFSQKLILIIGLILFFGHNALDYYDLPQSGAGAIALQLFFRSNAVIALDESHNMLVLYAILPWTAAMFLGYSIGTWFHRDFPAVKRKRLLLYTGLSLVGIFLVIRYFNLYGNPRDWQRSDSFWKSVFAFLNTSKYPPSLQYLCMTLGPACIFLSFTENIRTGWSRFVSVYGRV